MKNILEIDTLCRTRASLLLYKKDHPTTTVIHYSKPKPNIAEITKILSFILVQSNSFAIVIEVEALHFSFTFFYFQFMLHHFVNVNTFMHFPVVI